MRVKAHVSSRCFIHRASVAVVLMADRRGANVCVVGVLRQFVAWCHLLVPYGGVQVSGLRPHASDHHHHGSCC